MVPTDWRATLLERAVFAVNAARAIETIARLPVPIRYRHGIMTCL